MERVISRDGTPIAFDRTGSGPAVILVDGAMCYRGFGPMPALAKRLAPDFTVYHYDRRGRGDSGNGDEYAVDREIEDLQAVLQAAGGSAHVFGASSGGALALEAARRLPGITSVAIYEAPFIVDGATPPDLTPYERAVFMFDGHDAAQLEAARLHWKAVKAAGHTATYWQQTPDRRWERKA